MYKTIAREFVDVNLHNECKTFAAVPEVSTTTFGF